MANRYVVKVIDCCEDCAYISLGVPTACKYPEGWGVNTSVRKGKSRVIDVNFMYLIPDWCPLPLSLVQAGLTMAWEH